MPSETAVLLTLGAFLAVSVAIGAWSRRGVHGEQEFLLGGRRLGPLVAGISASATSSSAWTLLGVSSYAYLHGPAAIWLFPSCVGGFCINWFLLAPRLRRFAAARGALTISDLLAADLAPAPARRIRRLVALLTFVALLAYISSQLQGAGKLFSQVFALPSTPAVLIGAAVVLVYCLLGGFLAISRNDTLQGLLMAATAVVLPVGALLAAGPGAALEPLLGGPGADWFRGYEGPAAFGFVIGLLGIGLGYPGQPHVLGFLMAVRDEAALRAARRYAIAWALLVYAGMILLGLAARRLTLDVGGDAERVMLAAAEAVFPPVVVGLMLAAVLSAILSTVDSQLLVATGAATHDLGARPDLGRSRLVMAAIAVAACGFALFGDPRIFTRVLSAWSAMGAGFGPLLLWLLWIGPVGARTRTVAILIGYGTSVVAYAFDETRNTWVERVLPFLLATAVLAVTSRRR